MKLPRFAACLWAVKRGNVKTQDVMGEVLAAGFSDRGSIPLISIKKPLINQRLLFFVFDYMQYCLKYC